MPKPETTPVPEEHISHGVRIVRGRRVLLDVDLAALYGVATKRLNEQVKRNLDRFPEDFLFQLSKAEVEALNRSQNASGSQKHRDPRFRPHAFTEHGAIMAAMVLNNQRAMETCVYVVRVFVRLREAISSNKELWHVHVAGRTFGYCQIRRPRDSTGRLAFPTPASGPRLV